MTPTEWSRLTAAQRAEHAATYGPPPPGWAPAAPAPQPRRWPAVIGVLVALFVVIGACSSTGPRSSSTAAGSGAGPSSAAPAAPAKPAGPGTTFGDGTWVVGEDIVAGTYRSPGAEPGMFDFCSVSTHSGDTTDSPTLDWLTARGDAPMRVKLTGKVKAIEVHGCQPFAKVG